MSHINNFQKEEDKDNRIISLHAKYDEGSVKKHWKSIAIGVIDLEQKGYKPYNTRVNEYKSHTKKFSFSSVITKRLQT